MGGHATLQLVKQSQVDPVRVELVAEQFGRCRACGGEGQLPLAIGTLPYLHFASGHTFFTQSLQERNGFMPACVHTTFQFGDTAEFTWGKRSRLREKGLSLVRR